MMSGSDNYEPDISRLWWPPHQLDTHRVKPHPQSSEAGDRCGLAFTRYEKKILTIICYQFEGWNHLHHQPVLKFPLFLPAG